MTTQPKVPLYPAGAVEVLATIRPATTPRSTYRGPSGRVDGPEETHWAAELAALRARHADPPEPTPEVPPDRPVETPAGWPNDNTEVRE